MCPSDDWSDAMAAVHARTDQHLAAMRSLEEPMRRFTEEAVTYYAECLAAGMDRNAAATMLITNALGVVLTAEKF